MTERDSFADLLRSPVEEKRRSKSREPRREPDGPRTSVALPVIGALVGAAVVLGGFLLARATGTETEQTSPPTTSAVVTTTLAATPPPGVSTGLPAGYTLVNDRVGVRPIRILERGDETFVAFTTAVLEGLDPDETAGFTGGRWSLELQDGTRVDEVEEFFDPLARGAFTLKFAVPAGSEPVAVHLTGEAVRNILDVESDPVDVAGLPATIREQRFVIDADAELVIDEVTIEPDGGLIEWHLEGSDDVSASVAPLVLLYNPEDNFPAPQRPIGFSSSFDLFNVIFDAAPTFRGQTIQLERPPVADPSNIDRIETRWRVNWAIFLPTAVEIPLDDVLRVTVEP